MNRIAAKMTKKILILLLLLLFPVGFILKAAPAGDLTPVNEWLIAGSFTSADGNVPDNVSFINETEAAPSGGDKVGTVTWKTVNHHIIDFNHAGFQDNENAVAYAFAYIYSGANQFASLYLGSDDGVMVWINGRPAWNNIRVTRGVLENEDRIDIRLYKGYNRLLVKVKQGGGNWGLVCNLSSTSPLRVTPVRPRSDEIVKAADVEVTGAELKYADKMAGFDFMVKNSGLLTRGPVQLRIIKGHIETPVEKIETSIPAGETRIISFTMSPEEAAGILAQDSSLISVEYDGESIAMPLPSTLALDLLTGLSEDPAASGDFRASARRLELATEIYGTRPVAGAAARAAMKDITAGRYDRLERFCGQILKEGLKNIPDLSGDTIHITGHAHMDMNWLWTYNESQVMFQDNIRQAVSFMERFGDFTMLQSQAAIYQYIEKTDPELFAKVRKYVKEGRFEPVGGMWTEGDLNLTGGEALCRTFLLGQRFFYDHFGRTAHVGWLPDDFGHISQFPQILKLAGCDYYYFMRCNPYAGTFWWTGSDSSRVLCFSGNGYNNTIIPDVRKEIDHLSPEKRRIFVPTGVGDHGGGPTLHDIEMIHKLDSTPNYPSIQFTTAEKFFSSSAGEMSGRPVHRGEMQFIFEGCYTSVAEIKENTRMSENSLYRAEYISSLRWLFGHPYPAPELKNLWETVAFNQFHDILPGSAIYETYKDAVADHKMVQKSSREIFMEGFRQLADEISFKTGMGQPVVVLNMQPRQGRVLVEAEVFSYESPATAGLSHWSDFTGYDRILPGGPTATLLLSDDDGNIIPAQITGGKIFLPGYRTRIQFVVDRMPAGGYKTFYADVSRPGRETDPIPEKDGTFETGYFTVTFDMLNGDIIRLLDKRTGREYVSQGGRLNRLQMYMEAPNGMKAWNIGKITEVQDLTDVESVKITENGPVRATLEVVKKWGNSKFIQRTYIYKSYPRIDFDLDAHWFETGDGEHDAPFLKTTFDLGMDNPVFSNQVPFDVLERPVNGQEVPAQQWVDVSDGKSGIALLNKTKFGHSFEKGQLRLSLLRATYSPDMYPNIGINHISYSLFPHPGDWKNGVWAEAENFNIPVYAAEPPSSSSGKGHANRPAEDSLVIVSPSSVIMSGIKQGEEGNNLIVRLAEVNGKETAAELTLPVNISEAIRVNIIEFPQKSGNEPEVAGNTVRITLEPHEIVTLSMKFGREESRLE